MMRRKVETCLRRDAQNTGRRHKPSSQPIVPSNPGSEHKKHRDTHDNNDSKRRPGIWSVGRYQKVGKQSQWKQDGRASNKDGQTQYSSTDGEVQPTACLKC